ncbi:MAG: hypothetical protein WC547_09540, partial [Candidatus Omnitrophota bacterium]
KFHVHEQTTLGSIAGDYQILETISGRVNNVFKNKIWLYRDIAGADWHTARLHDGISIDSAYSVPGVSSKVWWERDPANKTQSWGDTSVTYMTINDGNVGIGTTSPEAKLQIEKNDGSNGAGGLTNYGVITTANAGQATLGAEFLGDGVANLNLGQNQAGIRRFWHISSRPSTVAHPYSLAIYNYNGTAFSRYMDLTTDGEVTKPSQPAFVARYTGSISAPNYIKWGSVLTNTGGCYSSTTGLFTAPVDGMYMFGFHILLPSAGTGDYRFAFYKNGAHWDCAIYTKDADEAGTWHTIALTDIVYLNAGDTFGVYYQQGAGAAYNDANYNRFWGYLLG